MESYKSARFRSEILRFVCPRTDAAGYVVMCSLLLKVKRLLICRKKVPQRDEKWTKAVLDTSGKKILGQEGYELRDRIGNKNTKHFSFSEAAFLIEILLLNEVHFYHRL